MKNRMSAILIGLPIPFCAGTYDFNSYCDRLVGEASGGGSQSLATCQQEEEIAQDNIARMDVPPDVLTQCRKKARVENGGYKTAETCINEALSSQGPLTTDLGS